MAEPVGITGTAAGLVSLGLQLYSEISSYLAAYKGRQKDLDFARHKCANLKRCIDAIDAAITSPGFRPTVSRDALDASVQGCQRELDGLNELVVGLQGPSLPATTVPAKLRETGRKLAFPFHQKGLHELEKRLESTVHVLQLAAQTLGLDVLLTTHVELGEIKSAVDVVHTTTEDIRTDIECLSRNVESIHISTSQVDQLLPAIEGRTATISVSMAHQAEAMVQAECQVSARIDDSTRSILGEISRVDNRFDRVEGFLADISKQIASQRNSASPEHIRLVGVAKPTTSNGLFGFETKTERATQHGSMSDDYISRSLRRPGNETSLCSCIQYRSQKHRRIHLGPVMLQANWRAVIRHSEKCPMVAIMKGNTQRSHKVEFTTPALQSLTGKAIRVFWSLTTGKEGISLGHGINVISRVDPNKSTTFRLVEFAQSMLYRSTRFHDLTSEDIWQLLGATWRRLVYCFVSGKGSPTDTDERGKTLLYSLLQDICHKYILGYKHFEIEQQLIWLVHSLQLLQVPSIPSDHERCHSAALATIPGWSTERGSAQKVMRKLLSHETDIISPFRPIIGEGSSRQVGILKEISITTAEALNFPDLHICILRQDENGVSQILQDNPESIHDTNCFGQNPVHMGIVVGNPRVFRTILLYADALTLNDPDYPSKAGRPIEYAVERQLHINCPDPENTGCNGCDILEQLLQSDCALYPSFFPTIFCGCSSLYESTEECALRTVMIHLKDRRQRLQEYAKKHLSPAKAAELGLYRTNLLDECAGLVQAALQNQSIFVPMSLRVFDDARKCRYYQDHEFRSIHSYISDAGIASEIWELGFRDLGVDSTLGFYELWASVLMGTSKANHRGESDRSRAISHAHWLVKRGAELAKPLSCPIPGQSKLNAGSWTAAHLLSAYLVPQTRKMTLSPLADEISRGIASTSIFDNCRCACASNGCSPLLILLHGLVTMWDFRDAAPKVCLYDYKHFFQSVCDYWAICTESKHWVNSSKPTAVVELVLSYLTFTAMGIRHSCCRLAQAQYGTLENWDIDEMEEIMEEQQERILVFQAVLEGFKEEYAESPELGTFIHDEWGPIMEIVLEELNARKLDEDNVRATEALGVRWHCFETESVEEDCLQSSYLEQCMDELNGIAPEPGLEIPLAPNIPVHDV